MEAGDCPPLNMNAMQSTSVKPVLKSWHHKCFASKPRWRNYFLWWIKHHQNRLEGNASKHYVFVLERGLDTSNKSQSGGLSLLTNSLLRITSCICMLLKYCEYLLNLMASNTQSNGFTSHQSVSFQSLLFMLWGNVYRMERKKISHNRKRQFS